MVISSVASSTETDLTLCGQEPIHRPGAIQPHGAVLAVLENGWQVAQASGNLAAVLGQSAETALGRSLPDVIGEAPFMDILRAEPRHGPAVGLSRNFPGPADTLLNMQVHRSGRYVCIDIEELRPEAWQRPSLTLVQSVVESYKAAHSLKDLCELAVRGVKDITGYDRVMAYQFSADGHGQVIAEACRSDLPPYLGQHYPATDIPAQARRQYLLQRVGMIADAGYRPVPLIVAPSLGDAEPLDLTYSALRSVSPVHRRYMANMDTAASLTIGLVDTDHLWGMLVCHHATPRIAGPELRAVVGLLGVVASLLIGRLNAASAVNTRLERTESLRALNDRLTSPGLLDERLAAMQSELLGLVGATGALVQLSGKLLCLGHTPPLATCRRVLEVMHLEAAGEVLAVDDLELRHPELACCREEASGALLLPLGKNAGDAILWFRPELAHTVVWGGDPTRRVNADTHTGEISPRRSFEAWKELVNGRSAPWSKADLQVAGELRQVIEAEQRRREFERSNADLEEFSQAVSHDLKAPLRAIGHLAEWIGEDLLGTADPGTLENVKLLQARVVRMQKLLDGLLEYSRVDRSSSVTEDVHIPGMISNIVDLMAISPEFTVICEGEWPLLRTEPAGIGMVLENLISNGVRHHDRPAGRITIRMVFVGGVAEFCVSDDGPGIDERFHRRIFAVFETLKSRDDLEASGIGLAIVKRKVEAHGGRIWVESAPPARGATFKFTWRESAP